MKKKVIAIIGVLLLISIAFSGCLGGDWAFDALSTRVKISTPSDWTTTNLNNFIVFVETSQEDAGFADTSGNVLEAESVTEGYWVKLDTLTPGVNEFYMYYGGNAPVLNNPWDNYELVLHFDETVGNYVDSSTNGFTATETAVANRLDGYIGNGPRFVTSSEKIDFGHHDEFEYSSLHVETWVKSDNVLNEYAICSLEPRPASIGECNDQGWNIEIGWNDMDFLIQNGETGRNITSTNDNALENNTWYHLCVDFQAGGIVKFYINGVEATSYSTSPHGHRHFKDWTPNDNTTFRIASNGYSLSLRGNIDELRYSGYPRGENWANACYENQRVNTLTFGVEELR